MSSFKEIQLDFYRSSRWIHLREAYKVSQDFICERCQRVCWGKGDEGYNEAKERGQEVVFGIVHHKEHLNASNINDPKVSLGWDNLELLCITCHNKEHSESMNKGRKKASAEVRKDVKFDSNGNIII